MHRYGVRFQNDLILTIDMTTSWTVVIYRCVTQVSEADETQQSLHWRFRSNTAIRKTKRVCTIHQREFFLVVFVGTFVSNCKQHYLYFRWVNNSTKSCPTSFLSINPKVNSNHSCRNCQYSVKTERFRTN